MSRLHRVAALCLALGGCGIGSDPAPAANVPQVCENAVFNDPTVKDLMAKSAGAGYYARNAEDQLRYAKLDAAHRCLQQHGLIRGGGGVERQRVGS